MSSEGAPSPSQTSPAPAPFVERRKQVHKQLDAVRRLSEAFFQQTKVDALVKEALNTALEVMHAEAGSVLLSDSASKQLIFHHSIGAHPVPYGTAIPWDKGIVGSVFQSGTPAVINEVKKDARHFSGIDKDTGLETLNMMSLPLKRWQGTPIGVLNILNKREGGFYDDDVATLTVISAITAAAIEQARLFEEAKLAEVARLLGDIGHDIKNMLTPVVMGAGILQDEVKDLYPMRIFQPQMEQPAGNSKEEETRERFNMVIDMLRNASRRIQDRVKEIADCVKGVSSPPQFKPCRLSSVMQSILNTLGLLAEEKGLTVRCEGLEGLPPILADDQRLYNAFYNLINNAIPEVPKGGSITVRGQTEPATASVLVSVIDTGRGMPPEVRDSLFTARAISRKAGGTGLGTKIVKDVVDAHGGQITVESQEGVGTQFHVRLPLQPPNATAQKDNRPTVSRQPTA